ncbi:MAG: hypothetical protein CR988_00140 [Treponema sp.]|nr:MAG: hypothetical protein CR988_00140 [Treponema sp.]
MKKTYSPLLAVYLLRLFLPVFLVAMFFFVLILQLGDLFFNLITYIENDIPFSIMLRSMFLFLPKCISYSVPLSMLFAGGYTIGNLYANNELTAIFSSGVSLYMFVIPIVIFSFLVSIGMFFFEDRVVIKTFAEKNKLLERVTNANVDLSSSQVAIRSQLGKVIYYANVYDDVEKKLIDVKIITRTDDGKIESIIFAPQAVWSQEAGHWFLKDASSYIIKGKDIEYSLGYDRELLTEPPSSFQRDVTNVDEMTAKEAKAFIERIKRAGLPYSEHLVKYHQRFSYSFTIFIVLLMSISFGGAFKVNVLIMNLLASLSFAIVYYISQMLITVFASWGIISPVFGAWLPFALFLSLGIYFLKKART